MLSKTDYSKGKSMDLLVFLLLQLRKMKKDAISYIRELINKKCELIIEIFHYNKREHKMFSSSEIYLWDLVKWNPIIMKLFSVIFSK